MSTLNKRSKVINLTQMSQVEIEGNNQLLYFISNL